MIWAGAPPLVVEFEARAETSELVAAYLPPGQDAAARAAASAYREAARLLREAAGMEPKS